MATAAATSWQYRLPITGTAGTSRRSVARLHDSRLDAADNLRLVEDPDRRLHGRRRPGCSLSRSYLRRASCGTVTRAVPFERLPETSVQVIVIV